MKKPFLLGIVLLFAFACSKTIQPNAAPGKFPQNQAISIINHPTSPAATGTAAIAVPVPNALSRVTKKPFGIYITPGNSPVQPEKFQGYHTGVDFETFSNEQDSDVPVNAICTGPLIMKKIAQGYGGVAVQKCTIRNQAVTVIYGHVRLSSIAAGVGAQLAAAKQFAVLGKGYSSETDGERKHLHLGIHVGNVINIRGYVQHKADLSQWLDARTFMQ